MKQNISFWFGLLASILLLPSCESQVRPVELEQGAPAQVQEGSAKPPAASAPTATGSSPQKQPTLVASKEKAPWAQPTAKATLVNTKTGAWLIWLEEGAMVSVLQLDATGKPVRAPWQLPRFSAGEIVYTLKTALRGDRLWIALVHGNPGRSTTSWEVALMSLSAKEPSPPTNWLRKTFSGFGENLFAKEGNEGMALAVTNTLHALLAFKGSRGACNAKSTADACQRYELWDVSLQGLFRKSLQETLEVVSSTNPTQTALSILDIDGCVVLGGTGFYNSSYPRHRTKDRIFCYQPKRKLPLFDLPILSAAAERRWAGNLLLTLDQRDPKSPGADSVHVQAAGQQATFASLQQAGYVCQQGQPRLQIGYAGKNFIWDVSAVNATALLGGPTPEQTWNGDLWKQSCGGATEQVVAQTIDWKTLIAAKTESPEKIFEKQVLSNWYNKGLFQTWVGTNRLQFDCNGHEKLTLMAHITINAKGQLETYRILQENNNKDKKPFTKIQKQNLFKYFQSIMYPKELWGKTLYYITFGDTLTC